MEPIIQMDKHLSARQVLLKTYAKQISERLNISNSPYGYEMPITGGWGYDKDSAVIIDKFDPIVNQNLPFNGIQLEYIFARFRAYLELVLSRDKSDRFMIEDTTLEEQTLIHDETKVYDKMIFNVSALPLKDFMDLKNEWESNCDLKTFDEEAHFKKRIEKTITVQREYWFEISSFYGQDLVI